MKPKVNSFDERYKVSTAFDTFKWKSNKTVELVPASYNPNFPPSHFELSCHEIHASTDISKGVTIDYDPF